MVHLSGQRKRYTSHRLPRRHVNASIGNTYCAKSHVHFVHVLKVRSIWPKCSTVIIYLLATYSPSSLVASQSACYDVQLHRDLSAFRIASIHHFACLGDYACTVRWNWKFELFFPRITCDPIIPMPFAQLPSLRVWSSSERPSRL